MRLLLLEDDKTLGPWIENGLQAAGYRFERFVDGKQALMAAMNQPYDILVLDRMVPSVDGLSVLKTLRQANITTPAMFLTALGDVEDRVEGLRAGGDDYLLKPFAFSELLARIEVMARRQQERSEEDTSVLAVGDIVLNLHKRNCTRQGQCIDLNPKEF